PIAHRNRNTAATCHPNVRPRISASRKKQSLLGHSCRCFIRVTYAGGFRLAPPKSRRPEKRNSCHQSSNDSGILRCCASSPRPRASEPIAPMMGQALSPSVIRMKEPGKEDYSAGNTRQPVIWFEVEDFLRYFDHFRNPSGVQRVSFEIYRVAKTLDRISARVRFCRLSIYSKRLHTVDFGVIRSAYLSPLGSIAPWKTFW